MKLSSYRKSEKTEIKQLFENVFSESEGLEEAVLISGLVIDLIDNTKDQDIFGFVVKDKEKIIAGIFFTRLSFKDSIDAFILSPVAVDTRYQGKGIGQKLINYGLEHLRDKEVKLAFTYGDPNFYSKVGFQCLTEDIIQAPQKLSQTQGWLCQSLQGDPIVPIPGKSSRYCY